MPQCRVRIRNGYKAIREMLEEYKRLIYRYNSVISGTGYYLKPTHIVTKKLPDGTRLKYVYIGRYWWKITYASKKGRKGGIRWKYVGREKPSELLHYPDPPENPLTGLRFTIDGDDIILDCSIYKRFKWLFAGYEVAHE